jgi:cobalamin biosynthesis Mg chelatase CobN
MWDADEETLQNLRELYSDVEDEMEGVSLAKTSRSKATA